MSDEKILSIDEMLAAEDVSYITVPAPEWGGAVKFGSIDAGTMIEFAEASNTAEGKDSTIRLIVQSMVDAEGKRLVAKEHIGNYIELFKKKDVRVMNRCLDAVMKLNDIVINRVQIKNVLSEAATAASLTE